MKDELDTGHARQSLAGQVILRGSEAAGGDHELRALRRDAESDAVVLVTEWPALAKLDWPRVKAQMRSPLVIDGRNFLSQADLLWHGFEYCGIGR